MLVYPVIVVALIALVDSRIGVVYAKRGEAGIVAFNCTLLLPPLEPVRLPRAVA